LFATKSDSSALETARAVSSVIAIASQRSVALAI
jgi:hypothetical protein